MRCRNYGFFLSHFADGSCVCVCERRGGGSGRRSNRKTDCHKNQFFITSREFVIRDSKPIALHNANNVPISMNIHPTPSPRASPAFLSAIFLPLSFNFFSPFHWILGTKQLRGVREPERN